MKKQRQRAFTLIELLVSTTIIIILTTIGMVSYRQAGINSRNSRRQIDLEVVRQALLLYKQDNGMYHPSSTINFGDLVNNLRSNGYLTGDQIVDPRGGDGYLYTAVCTASGTLGCNRVELGAYLEPDAEPYTLDTL